MVDQATVKVLREETIAPAGHFAAEIRKGQVLRIVDLEGQQVADLVTINAGNLAEKLSVMNTISLNKQVFPRVGYVLYSDEARGMMTDHCRYLRRSRHAGRRLLELHQRKALWRERHQELPRQSCRRA